MISICIPVYNYPITGLVETLRKQADQLKIPVEIVILDDASDPSFQQQNKEVEKLVDQYVTMPVNVGRSRIRNQFLQYARFEYCLFLDCDLIPAHPNFLSVYADRLDLSPTVIFGGRIFPESAPSTETLLRWKYGTEIESKTAAQRQADPYRHFHSNNFLIRKSVLETIRFEESLSGYGYEDSLFSLELKLAAIPVSHIDNPVLNLHIETTEKFLNHIDESMRNLVIIGRKHDVSDVVNLVNVFRKYQSFLFLLPDGYSTSIRNQLLKGNLNLRMLQVYKLLSYSRALNDSFNKDNQALP